MMARICALRVVSAVCCARCILLKNYELFNAYRSVLSTCNDIHFDKNITHRAFRTCSETLTRDRVKTENVQNVLMAFAIIREWVLPAIIVKNRSLKL